MNVQATASVTSIDPVGYDLDDLTTYVDKKYACAWCYLHPQLRPCFTTGLLNALNGWVSYLGKHAKRLGVKYHVIASDVPGVFNLGGDLDLFRNLAMDGDRDRLMDYGKACVDALYGNVSGFDQDVTTISLVQGEALGGGFEVAVSSDVIIAEKGSRMGFPEILFNLFPGMGAYSILSRRLGPKPAEKIILSGKCYTAEELYEVGLVDVLVSEGEGEEAVYEYIKRENRARNGYRAMRRVRDYCNPITRKELIDIVEIWVDTVLELDQRDLRMMKRLVSRQYQQGVQAA